MNESRHRTSPEPIPDSPENVPSVSWSEFLNRFRWEQGEHVTLVGPTGGGKTTLALKLLHMRRFVIILVAKRRDSTMDGVRKQGYVKQEKLNPEVADRIVLWPTVKKLDEVHRVHFDVFSDALNEVYLAGGWCVFVDEATYLSDMLNMKKQLSMLWQQGRSLGVSIVAATQRPAYIPLYAYDQATHLFLWRDNDHENLSRLSGLGGADNKLVRRVVPNLEKHEVLYLNTRTGEMLRTIPEV